MICKIADLLVEVPEAGGMAPRCGEYQWNQEDGAEIVIHREDAPMLTDAQLNASWLVGEYVIAPQATRTVAEGDQLTYAGAEITVLHTPGHTPGCVCYQAGEWLFTGDTLFRMGYGRTDLYGGNAAQLQQSLDRLMKLEGVRAIYPGHDD